MAQKYRKVDPRFWDDEEVFLLDTQSKLLALYLMTSKQTNRCGLYRLSPALACEDLGYTPDIYAICMRYILKSLNWMYDPASRVLFIPSWYKYNEPNSWKVLIGGLQDLHDVPRTPLARAFYDNLKYLPDTMTARFKASCLIYMPYISELKPICMPYDMPFQEQDQEQDIIDIREVISKKSITEEDEGAELEKPEAAAANKKPKESLQIPEELKGLELYEADDKLCKRYPEVLASWKTAFPGVDIPQQIKVAHAWEVANPTKRKVDRIRFLNNWLSREQDRRKEGNYGKPQSNKFAMQEAGKFAGR